MSTHKKKTLRYVEPMMRYEGDPNALIIGSENDSNYRLWLHDTTGVMRVGKELGKPATGHETRFKDVRVRFIVAPNGDFLYLIDFKNQVRQARRIRSSQIHKELTRWPLGTPAAFDAQAKRTKHRKHKALTAARAKRAKMYVKGLKRLKSK